MGLPAAGWASGLTTVAPRSTSESRDTDRPRVHERRGAMVVLPGQSFGVAWGAAAADGPARVMGPLLA